METSPCPRWALETMRFTPDSPRSTFSCGSMISASTSSGAAARHPVRMVISGRSTSGVSWIGRRERLSAPNRTTSSTATSVAVGLESASRVQLIPVAWTA